MESGLKYPTFNIKVKHEGQKALVFDQIRKKWIQLTPEEWVRQHFINYIITKKGVPVSLISIEKEINLNDTKRRYDVVVYNSNLKPVLLVECKAPDIEITQETANQALRYNLILNVKYLVLTNGINEFVIVNQNNQTHYINELPDYSNLNSV